MKPTKALYVGSFDPFTVGHLDIVERALRTYETVYIGVGCNPNKNTFFSASERVELIKEVFKNHPKSKRIQVLSYTGSTIDLAMSLDIHVLIRGMRFDDQTFEETNATANKLIAKTRNYTICTELLVQNDDFLKCVSSTAVKTLCNLGEYEAAHRYVPPVVHQALMEKYLYPTFATLFCSDVSQNNIMLAWKKIVSLLKPEIFDNLSDVAYKINMFNIYLRHNRNAEIERYQKEILASTFLTPLVERIVNKNDDVDEDLSSYYKTYSNTVLRILDIAERKYGKLCINKDATAGIVGEITEDGPYNNSQKLASDLYDCWLGTNDEKLFEHKIALLKSVYEANYGGEYSLKQFLIATRNQNTIFETTFFYNMFEHQARTNIFKQIMHMKCTY